MMAEVGLTPPAEINVTPLVDVVLVLFLRAEDESSYADVIAVMDLVRHAGAARIGAILTSPAETRR